MTGKQENRATVVSPALTIRIFSYYVLATGLFLVLFPAAILSVFRIELTDSTWVRVLGLAVLTTGVYYLVAAANEATWFFRASIVVRIALALGLLLLALTNGPIQLIGLGLVEAGGALWTRRALHKTERWA